MPAAKYIDSVEVMDIHSTLPRPVMCVETGQKFASIRQAGQFIGTQGSGMHVALKLGKKCKGYHWVFLDEEESKQFLIIPEYYRRCKIYYTTVDFRVCSGAALEATQLDKASRVLILTSARTRMPPHALLQQS
eukprot:g61123.t1